MKKLATSLLALTAGILAYAQGPITSVSGGPDAYGYSWISSESQIDTIWCIECDTTTIASTDTTFCFGCGPGPSDTIVSIDTIYADTINGYTGVEGPDFNWIDITTTGTNITGSLADDNSAGPFNVGFSLPFYWYSVDKFFIGSNGYVMFDKGTTISSGQDPAFPTFPTSSDNHESFVAPYLADLNLGQDAGGQTNPGEIYQYTNGTDSLIISFIDVPFWNDNNDGWGGANTYQVIFSKADTSITLNYLSQSGFWNSGYDGNSGATQIGMESVGAISGLQIASSVYPQDSLGIVISLDLDPSFSVTDISAAGNNNIKNGGIFASGSQETTLSTNIQNIGTEDISTPFNVDVKLSLSSSGGGARFQSTESISSLNAGVTQDLTVSQVFNPADPSTLLSGASIDLGSSYYMVTSFNVPGDGNSGNNNKASEVAVLNDTDPTSVPMTFATMELQSAGEFGFEGGGVYLKPPYYPCDIFSLDYFLVTADAAPTGSFNARMWLDDGVNGTPGTLVTDKLVASTSIVPNFTDNENGITQVFLDAPVTITEGGIYVGIEYVDFDASTFRIAEDVAGTPKSNQNYEILSGTFGEYRSNADADLMIGVSMTAPLVGLEENLNSLSIGDVYPNPSTDIASVKVDVTSASKVSYSVKNVIGQEVKSENLGTVSGQRVINFNVSDLETGIYFCTVTINGNSTTKKFTVK